MRLEIADLPVSYRIEHVHQLSVGVLEVRRYFWSRRVEEDVLGVEGALVLDMALTSRPLRTKLDRIEPYNGSLGGDVGRLVIMMPGAPYHVSAPRGAVRSFNCSLRCEAFERVVDHPVDWASLSDLGSAFKPGATVERVLVGMYDEVVHPRIASAAVIDALATVLCVELYRCFREGRLSRPDVQRGGLASWRMRLLADRVHADLPAPRVEELADLCGLTSRQLSRAFKVETGMTIGRYANEAVMERAHRLLTSTDLTIAAIARELGFAGPDSFAQSYRRITGGPPSRTRRR